MATRTTNRQNWPGRSEFTGEVRNNTLREARNREVFLSRGQELLGFPIDVIPGREEARLIYVTGTEGVEAEPDRRAWLGLKPEPESVIDFKD